MRARLRLFLTSYKCILSCLIPVLYMVFMAHPSYAEVFNVKNLGDYGNVTVMEVTGNYDAKQPDGTPNVEPRQGIAKEFFKTHKDEYDFIVVFSNFNMKMPESEARAFYSAIKNDVHGIGRQIFDYSAQYGSNGKLQGTIDMGNIANNASHPLDHGYESTLATLSHEMLHRWGAYVRFKSATGNFSSALIGKDGDHWSYLFDSKASVQYGNQWQDNGNGTFTSGPDLKKFFSPLDLYLMGMIDKSQVPTMLLIDNPAIDPARMPEAGVTISGTPKQVTIDDIIAAEGERVPSAKDAQKQFKTAFIFIASPGTFTGDELYGIENIRNGFLTRYSILTNGQGLVQIASTPKDEVPVNPGVRPATTVPRTLPPNVDDGVKWLLAGQQADGSWTDFALTTERDTSEVVTTLQRLAAGQQQFQAGLVWLGSNASANTDFLARRIEVTVQDGADAGAVVQELLSRSNPDGGWGSGRSFVSNATDTALALKALARAGYLDPRVVGRAVAYLQTSQNQDGGWSGGDSVSTIQPTAAVVSAFNAYRKSYGVEVNLSRAIAFLSGKQNPDGGFGNSPSTVYDSAMAVMALQEAGADRGIIGGGVNYLQGQQTDSGSWLESPYQTALAVRAIWVADVDPDLSLKTDGISFIPAKVTALPTVAVVSAVIWNVGRSDVAQAKVAIYDGAVAPDKKVGEQTVALPGSSPVTVTFSVPVTDGNGHYFHVVVDPDNLVKESNENNNSAAKALLPEANYDFEVMAADLAIAPNPADMGQDVTVTVKVSNRGTLDAYNLPVRFFIDAPSASFDIATVTVDIPAGGSVTKGVAWKASKAGSDMPLTVVVDPLNAFTETTRGNNRAVMPLTVNGSILPNLMVSYKDIVVSPSPVNQGGSAHISVQVRNNGFAPATNVKVSFYNGEPEHNGVLLGSQALPAVNPGDSVTASIDWLNISESGGKVVYVRVDPDNAIMEIAKDDNDAFNTLAVLTLPDLVISSSSVVLTPAVPKDGDTAAIAVTLQNNGDQDAANVSVQLNEGGTAIGTAVIPLAKGHSQTIATIQYNATGQTGSHSITVLVDPENKIPEQSKDNNTAVKVFGVQNANLWLSEPYFSPNGDGIKDTTQFSFRLNSPTSAKVIVTDKNGDAVRTFSGGDLDATHGSVVTWDGRNDNGIAAGDGTYQFKAVDANNNTVLGSLPVVLDTDRSPITDAVGTKFFQKTDLSCGLPAFRDWQRLPDGSGILFYIEQGNEQYPRGLYLMGPDGGDIANLTPREWGDSSDTLYDYLGFQNYKVSPDGTKIVFVLNKLYKLRQATSFTDVQQLVVVDLTTNVMTIAKTNYVFIEQQWFTGWGYQPTVVKDYNYVTDYDWSRDVNTVLYQDRLQTVDTGNINYGQSKLWQFNVNVGGNSLVLTMPTAVRYFLPTDEVSLIYTTTYDSPISTSYLGMVNLDSGVNTYVENNLKTSTLANIVWTDSGSKFAYRIWSKINGKNNYTIKIYDVIGSTKTVYSSEVDSSFFQNHNVQWVANDKIVLTEDEGVDMSRLVKSTKAFLIDTNENGTPIKLQEVNRNVGGTLDGLYISPNKQQVAFVVREDKKDTPKLKVADLEGNVSILYNFRSSDYGGYGVSTLNSLTWSPDSSRIAFFVWGWGYGLEWNWTPYGSPSYVASSSGKVMIANIASGETTVLGAPISLGSVASNSQHSSLFKWQPDGLSFSGGSSLSAVSVYSYNYEGYWFKWNFDILGISMYDTVTGGSVSLLDKGVHEYATKFAVSPLSRYLTYEVRLDPGDSCHPIYNYSYTDFNLKSVSFLNNLTADLRVTNTNSALTLKGIAQDLNFEGYKLEYADVGSPGVWNLIVPPADESVVNGVFATWLPPNGSFHLRLTVWDKAGNTATSHKRVSWGRASTSITSFFKTNDFISPNADGVKDTVGLHYRILAPVHLEFNVHDESNNLVKTFSKDYASAVEDFISWDGRDDSGRVVPDGKYKIKVLDYEFFLEVDTTSPKASANISQLLFDEVKNLLYVDLSALVTDKNIKSWKIEYGEGNTPQEWHQYKTGNDVLVNRDDKGNIISSIQSALVQRYYDQNISLLKGKKFRVVAEDFAGNRNIAISDFLEEKVILSKWDDTFVVKKLNEIYTTSTIPANMAFPANHAVNGFDTLRVSAANTVLQYWNGKQWFDAVEATDLTSGMLNLHWDSFSSGLGEGYGVRVKIVDSLGGVHHSNVLTTAGIFSVDSSCSWSLIGQNALFESMKLLRLQVQSSQDVNYLNWTDYKIYDAVKGDSMPSGEFLPPLPTIKSGIIYQIRMAGTGGGGQTYVTEPTNYPPNCPVKISLEVTYDEAKGCGEVAPGIVSLAATAIDFPSNVSFKTLSYFIQKPEGSQLLHTFDIVREGWKSLALPTTGLPEGIYPVKAVLSYLDQAANKMKVADTTAVLTVDRVLPATRITYPAGNSLKLCPIKVSGSGGDWLGIPVEGVVADNVGVKRYELHYGSGDNPAEWLTAKTPFLDRGTVVNLPITGNGPVQGAIGTWNIAGVSGGSHSLRLKMIDASGNVSCATTSVSFDNAVGIPIIAADKPLISPNGDGIADDVRLNFQTDAYASVGAKVFKVLDSGGLDALPVRVLASGKPYLAGLQSLVWDGKTEGGIPVSDSRYGMAVFATDSCGNTNMKWAPVEVDDTPPMAVIGYPKPTDTLLGNVIEVKGTATDSHFQTYILESGQGDSPTAWVTISSGASQVNSAPLGVWNSYGLTGKWTLRLSALDKVGSKSSTTSTIDLGERKTLVKSVDIAPKVISPNNDNKLETALISYELADSCQVRIDIFDTAGTTVKSYAADSAPAGNQTFRWDGRNIAATMVADGTYQVKLTAFLLSNPAASQTETLSITVDTTSPLIDMKHPADKAYLNASKVSVTGTISERNLLAYSLKVTGPAGLLLEDAGNQSRTDYVFGNLDELAEGDYTISAEAKDLSENATSVTRAFTLDRTAPKSTLDRPKNGEYYGAGNGIINLAGSLMEKNLQIFSLRYGVGDAPTEWHELAGGNTLTALPKLHAWKVGKDDGISDGLYSISFYAKDKAGLEGEARAHVTIDNTSPVVAFGSIHDGDLIRGSIDITGDLKDSNLDKGILELAEGNCDAAAKWSPLKNFSASVLGGVLMGWKILPADGDYCLKLSAVDKAGNKASAAASFKINTHPPVSPALTGKIEDKTNVQLSWPKNSESDLAGYNVYRDSQKLNTALLADITYTDSNLKAGTYAYTATAVNQAGAESSVSSAVKLRIDTVGPDALFSSPQNGAKVNDLFDVKGNAYSTDDFKEYRLYVGQGQNPVAWNLIRKSPLPLKASILAQWDTTVLPDGSYSLKLEAEDLSGNVTLQTISINIDNTPPTAPVLLSAINNGADVTLNWAASPEPDLAGYLLYRNDQLANGVGAVVRNLKPYLITGTTYVDKAVPDGKYAYYLVAVDPTGNVGNLSNSLSVIIDIRPPHATITDPATNRKFEQKIILKAESLDNDIASIQFQYKKAQDSSWTNLGIPVTTRPFMIYFDLKPLALPYGNFQLQSVATDMGGKTDPAPTSINVIYTDLTPPATPADVQAVTTGNAVSLTWSNNAEPDLEGYNIYRTSGTTVTKITIEDAVYQDANLADGTYSYVITAIDAFGNESKSSSNISATVYAPLLTQSYTPVAQPSLTITGTNAAPNASVELIDTTAAGQTSLGSAAADSQGNFIFDKLVLAAGKNSLTAKVTDSAGNASRASDAVVVVYGQPPVQPTGVAATVEGYTVSLAWDANHETDLAGYNVYRDGVKLDGTSPSVITGQASASGYGYPSQAFDGDLATAWMSTSSNGSFIPAWWEVDFPSPELIKHLEIHWYQSSASHAGKDFEVQAWSGYAWIPLAKVSGNSLNDNSFDFVPSYPTDKIRISITDTNDPNYWKKTAISEVKILKDPSVSQTSYRDTNLRDGKYRYTITAVNATGFESSPSVNAPADVGDLIAPAPPQGLAAAVADSSVVLSWSPNGEADLAGYNIYRKLPDGWQKLNASSVTERSFSAPNLVNGTYTWRITAVDEVGNEGDPSSDTTAIIAVTLPQPPGKPRISTASEGRTLAISWDAAGGTTASYAVYRGKSSGGPYQQVATVLATALAYEDSGLLNGTVYYYVVSTVDGIGNESIYSIEAYGAPVDTVAPTKPLIFDPVLAGGQVRVYRGSADVAGTAEAGSTVELFKDNVSVGKTVALPSETTDKVYVDYSGTGSTPSPDARYIVYIDNTKALMIMDVPSGTTDKIVDKAGSPKWSSDGDKVAFYYTDATLNTRIGIYDVEAKKATPLTAHETVYEVSPSWSSDGSKIAYISNRENPSKRIWIKDLITGNETQTSVNGDYPTISPNGEKVAYFNGATLSVATLADGMTQQVNVNTDQSTLAWSPDSRKLIFQSYQSGNRDLHVMDLAAQTLSQITTDGIYKFTPTWSPDEQSIAYGRNEADATKAVWLTDLQGQNRMLKGIGSLSGLVWGMTGSIVFYDGTGKDVYTIHPQGQFVFNDMNLDPGENIFSAAAIDDTGNTSDASDTISVVFDTTLLPDIVVSSDEISIYPVLPKPGKDVTVNAVISNIGKAPVDNVDVDIYLWDSKGDLQLLGSETIAHLDGNANAEVAVRVNAGSNIGTQTIIVNVDPNNKIKELLKSNNSAAKDFYVTDKEEVTVIATLDSDQYASGQDARVTVAVINSGSGKDGVIDVMIEDAGGNMVASLASDVGSIPYGATAYTYRWNNDATLAGTYRAHVVFTGADGTLSESSLPLTILADIRVESSVVTNKQGYGANESVSMSLNVTNSGSNYIVPQLRVKVRILDSGNIEHFAEEKNLENIFPSMGASFSYQWKTGLNLPGTYQVIAEAYLDNKTVSSTTVNFTIDPVSVVTGAVSVNPAAVPIGSGFKAVFTAWNSGNVSASGILKAIMVDPETGATIASAGQLLSIPVNGSRAGEFGFSSQGMPLKTYLVSMHYISQGEQRNIGSARVTLKDVTPPAVTIVSPAAGTTFNGTATITIAALASDDGAGVDIVEYRLDDGAWKPLHLADPAIGRYTAAWEPTIGGNGAHTVSFRAADRAGNVTVPVTVGFEIQMDSFPPVTTITVGAPKYEVDDKLYVSSGTLFTLNATDDFSGVAKTEYRIDGGQWFPYAPFVVTTEGEGRIYYRSVDNAGNPEQEKNLKVILDRTPPTSVISASDPLKAEAANTVSPKTTFSLTATDNLTGVKGIWYRIDGGQWQLFDQGFTLQGIKAGAHTICYSASDNLGNDEVERTVEVRLVLADVKKEISPDSVVLVGAWMDNQNKIKNEGAIAALKALLSSLELTFRVAEDGDDFKTSLRSGEYTTYLLVDYKDEKVGEELREAVNYGDSLIYIKTRPSMDPALDEVFGMKFTGQTTSADLPVTVIESPLGPAETIQSRGKSVVGWIIADSAIELGYVSDKRSRYPFVVFNLHGGDKRSRYPSVVFNRYGGGKVALFTFDLLNSYDREKAAGLLGDAITFVKPERHKVRALESVPIKIAVGNSTEPIEVRITETIPVGTRADIVTPEGTASDTAITWQQYLGDSGSVDFRYHLNLPDAKGEYVTVADVGYANFGDYRSYETAELTLTVLNDSADLLREVIVDLNAISGAGSDDLVILTDAVSKLSLITLNPSGRKEAEKGIEAITRVAKLIRGPSADTAHVRLKLDELLKILERKWYLIDLGEQSD